jgi:hypothetical protein
VRTASGSAWSTCPIQPARLAAAKVRRDGRRGGPPHHGGGRFSGAIGVIASSEWGEAHEPEASAEIVDLVGEQSLVIELPRPRRRKTRTRSRGADLLNACDRSRRQVNVCRVPGLTRRARCSTVARRPTRQRTAAFPRAAHPDQSQAIESATLIILPGHDHANAFLTRCTDHYGRWRIPALGQPCAPVRRNVSRTTLALLPICEYGVHPYAPRRFITCGRRPVHQSIHAGHRHLFQPDTFATRGQRASPSAQG